MTDMLIDGTISKEVYDERYLNLPVNFILFLREDIFGGVN